jgi:hypothetical protein
MLSAEDQMYFERRAEHELKMAVATEHPGACHAHYMIASSYLDRLADARREAFDEQDSGHGVQPEGNVLLGALATLFIENNDIAQNCATGPGSPTDASRRRR